MCDVNTLASMWVNDFIAFVCILALLIVFFVEWIESKAQDKE